MDASGIARFMACVGPISSVFDVTTFAVVWFVMGASTVARHGVFQSGWFIDVHSAFSRLAVRRDGDDAHS
jgi:Mg2+-importing ATPase